jgi:hypothetical protein
MSCRILYAHRIAPDATPARAILWGPPPLTRHAPAPSAASYASPAASCAARWRRRFARADTKARASSPPPRRRLNSAREQVAHVASQRPAPALQHLQLDVLSPALQPCQCGLADPVTSSVAPAAWHTRSTVRTLWPRRKLRLHPHSHHRRWWFTWRGQIWANVVVLALLALYVLVAWLRRP